MSAQSSSPITYDVYYPFNLSTVTEWPGSSVGRSAVHMGTDFGIPHGTELRATASGRITRWNSDGLGAYVLDIVRGDGLLIRNAHLSAMYVNTGDMVEVGQVIGLTGGTPGTPGAGNTTGAHLHWELRWDTKWQFGAWADPRTMVIGTFEELDAPPLPLAPPIDERETEMFAKVNFDNGAAQLWNMLTGVRVSINETADYTQIESNFKTFNFATEEDFLNFQSRFAPALAMPTAKADTAAIAGSVAAAVGNVNVNVDALASAIALKLGITSRDVPMNKAEIIAAIEANYPKGA